VLVNCLVAANPESERYCIHNLYHVNQIKKLFVITSKVSVT
jgi:hypothetical protein